MPEPTTTIEVDAGHAAALRRFAEETGIEAQTMFDIALACAVVSCRDPEGPGDPFNVVRTEDVVPELAADFDALHRHVLAPLSIRTEGVLGNDGPGESISMTIELPRESAILAAWLELRDVMRRDGNLSPIGTTIDLDTQLAHRQKAKAYIVRQLDSHFHRQMDALVIHEHPCLLSPEPAAQRHVEGAAGGERS